MQEIKQQGCEQRKRVEWEETQNDLFGIDAQLLSLQQKQRVGSTFISEFRNLLITFTSAMAVIYGEMTFRDDACSTICYWTIKYSCKSINEFYL